eukprot:219611_1
MSSSFDLAKYKSIGFNICKIWCKSMICSAIVSIVIPIVCVYKCYWKHRCHWYEYGDLKWIPSLYHQFGRQFLYQVMWKNGFKMANIVSDIILPFINKYNISLILDLCSGSCGPSNIINQNINKNNNQNNQCTTTILTDLFPQISVWKLLSKTNQNLLYCSKPIDATSIKMDLINQIYSKKNKKCSIRLRTIFFAFHHFTPELCDKVFLDVFKNNDMLMICDPFSDKGYDCFIAYVANLLLMPYGTWLVFKNWLINDNTTNIMNKLLKISGAPALFCFIRLYLLWFKMMQLFL